MSREPTDNEIAMKALWAASEKMKARCGGIGEPAVYLPAGDIKTFVDSEGEIQAILGVSQFICLVDRVLRQS